MATETYENRRAQMPPIDYTQIDYNSSMTDKLATIPLISDRWTDYNASDLGMVTLRNVARAEDRLAYYIDARVQDLYLDTNRLRDTLFALMRLVDYKPHLAAGGTATLRITLDSPAVTGVSLAKWWQARSAATGTQYQMAITEAAAISAGQTTVDVGAVQGTRYTETFDGDGTAGQMFTMSHTMVCAVAVSVDGDEWSEVDSLVGQEADAKVYVVRLLWDGTVRVETGNGVEGAIPGSGAEVAITYLVTLGADGNNIGTGVITHPVDPVYDGESEITSQVTVTNLDPVTGGENEEEDADIKRNGPRCTHAMYKMGPGNDIRSLLEAYPGVARAQVLDLNNYSAIEHYHYAEVYVIPAGGGELSDTLKAELEEYISERADLCMDIRLDTATYVPVDIELTVYRYANYTDGEVQESVMAALQDYFSEDEDIGQVDWMTDVLPADILAEIDRLDGVSYAELDSSPATVSIGAGEFPVLGTISLTIVEATQ